MGAEPPSADALSPTLNVHPNERDEDKNVQERHEEEDRLNLVY